MRGICFFSYGLACGALAWGVTVCWSAPAPQVTGYVFPQNAVLQPGQIDPHSMTRINYAFANIEGGRMVTGYPTDAENLAQLTALKRENPSLSVLIAVGGWKWSAHFSDMALTAESRGIFIQSVIDFLKQYDLDGLDVDWEYPGMPGASNAFRSEDKQNFTLLLEGLRKRFDEESKMTHKRLYLTIAAGADEDYLEHTEMAKVETYVDAVNLMAYDYCIPSRNGVTCHDAPLYSNPEAPMTGSADEAVRAFEKAGVPAAKILLGIPFYGQQWGEVASENHGLFQKGQPMGSDGLPYGTIADSLLNHGYTRYWDSKASAPYLYSEEKHVFVSYDDPESIAAKCNYALTHKLGGVMFWSYLNDPSGVLAGAIADTFDEARKGAAKKE
jgi:chitinase